MRPHILALLALVGVAGALLGIAATSVSVRAGNEPVFAKWEYHCVLPPGAMKADDTSPASAHELAMHDGSAAHPSERLLNFVGEKGWELVAIDPNNGHYCFKRPKP